MLDIAGLSLSFGGISALSGVSVRIEPRECFGVVGANGAGKTALLNCICGVYRPQEGQITFKGEEIAGWRPDRISRLGVGRTFQGMEHFADFTVLEYLLLSRAERLGRSALPWTIPLPGFRRREQAERETCMSILERCDIGKLAKFRLSEIPYGSQKRVDIARVIASESELVLLDEPTSGTTSAERTGISEVIDLLAGTESTVVLVDHDVDFVLRHTQRVLALDHGQVIAIGPGQEILDNPAVRAAFLGLQSDTADQR